MVTDHQSCTTLYRADIPGRHSRVHEKKSEKADPLVLALGERETMTLPSFKIFWDGPAVGFKERCASIVILFVAMAGPVNAASYDCALAVSETEILICQDQQLSVMDEELHFVYFEILSAIADKDAKVSLRAIQREWLKSRDKTPPRGMSKKTYTVVSYQRQLSRLEFFRKHKFTEAGLDKPDMHEILRLLVREKLPGLASIKKIDEDLYLLCIGDTAGSIIQGYYGANINSGLLQQLSNGMGAVLHDISTAEPVLVLKNMATKQGAMSNKQGVLTSNVIAIYRARNNLGLDSKTLAFVQEDLDDGGGCGRGEKIGLKKSGKLGDFQTSRTQDGLLLSLDIVEQNCISSKTVTQSKKYLLKEGVLEELGKEVE